jgi:hypothetical protein
MCFGWTKLPFKGGEMQKMLFAVILVFCFTLTYAKDPIPEFLLKAKTAVVDNSRAEQKDIDKLCEALKNWGRFELLQSKSNADIVITLTRESKEEMVTGPGGRMQNQQFLVNRIHIYKRDDDSLLWSDETSSYSKDPKVLVSKLKSTLKNK